ncbi:efflux RND transporter periplasmic adaptor subunit [Penaeicola halotolerans]|uniref:efflux RND transporter periplasmic adaptor subunit n=1 Tax=Penaeicola halotolerans TaxID=2793196 RepID=UPI001CF8A173|nr:efflux RND transporter periplasmic adaptor subunit [Penaeicola halotolerans]
MKRINIALSVIGTFLLFNCGGNDSIEAKKEALKELKKEIAAKNAEVRALETELAEIDPEFASDNRKATLVTTKPVQKKVFSHYVDVTGSVASKQNVALGAENGGRVVEVNVTEGQQVQKGQVLVRMDAESVQRNIDEVKTALELATTIYEKQKNLWDQEIGTEVQFLEAKNRKESLERQLASLQTQLSKSVIRAPFSGIVEMVYAKLGETLQPTMTVVQLVGSTNMYLEGDVSERFIGTLQKGDSVEVNFPSLNKNLITRISALGAVINENNRTFRVEAALPDDINLLKPNLIAVMKIKDYENKNAITVPTNLIQRDNRGDYIYIIKEEKANKVYLKRGKTYQAETEILEGLQGDETIIDKGFREVGNGFTVEVVK